MNPFPRASLFVILLCVGSFATAAAADDTSWQVVDSDLWIPITPDDDAPRVRFAESTPLDTRVWTVLAPGDTLDFAVRGSGTLRVETRPVLRTDAPARRFRLGVETATGELRRLVRRSALESWARIEGDVDDSLRVGEVDRWETPLVAGSARVRVFLRETRSADVLVRVLARGRVERPASDDTPAEARDAGDASRPWSLDVEAIAVGHDSNAYFTPADSSGARGEWFWPVEIDFAWDVYEARNFLFDFDVRFDTRRYQNAVLDETRLSFRTRQTFEDLDVFGTSRLRFEQRLRTRDKTFFRRGEDTEFEALSDIAGNANIDLGDRFDWAEGRLGAELRAEPDDDWTVTLDLTTARRDYTQDYDDEPGTWSLDQWRHEVELELERDFGGTWTAALESGFSVWDYDEKFSRDVDGALVETVPTRLHRIPLVARVEHRPSDAWNLGVTTGALWTDDRRQDYWSRRTWITSLEADWEAGPWSVDGRVRLSSTDYENATLVLSDPTTPIRSKSSFRLSLDGEYAWSASTTAGWRFDFESLDNDNRLFAYDQTRIVTFVRREW